METTLQVEGFEHIENKRVKILLSDNKYAIVHFTELSAFDEEVYRYFNDQNYYHGEINSMLESFVAEADDLEIKEEE